MKTIRTQNPAQSVARYSFIQLNELEERRERKPAQGLTRQQTRVLLVDSPKLWPLRYYNNNC